MKMLITTFLLLITSECFAPAGPSMIVRPEPINPYEKIWNVICEVESSGNYLAYHMEDNGFPSVGIAQVQYSRIIDFNRRTGNNYTLMDMYLPDKAKVVFMYYASEFNPNDNESISRCWNGGPTGMNKKSTEKYYLKVQTLLSQL